MILLIATALPPKSITSLRSRSINKKKGLYSPFALNNASR